MDSKKCEFFLPKKNRTCKMDAKNGEKYCCEHLVHTPQSDRIPCPLDPKHSVSREYLEKHLSICNSAKRKALIKHFSENINGNLGRKQSCVFSLSQITSTQEYKSYFSIINDLFENYSNKFKISSRKCSQIQSCSNSEKHKYQHEAIYSLLDSQNLIADDTSFVELCAGKGTLSRYIASQLIEKKMKNVAFALVDLSNFKRKHDVYIRNMNIRCERIQLDIQNLDSLKLLEDLNAKQCVFYAKHACGNATDVSISAIQKSIDDGSCLGVCIALCCHHRCTWDSFYGWSSLQQHTEEAEKIFQLLKQISSWCTCSLPDSCHLSELSNGERELIGWRCKRILDFARIDALLEAIGNKSQNFHIELCEYAPNSITPENICLLLRPTIKPNTN